MTGKYFKGYTIYEPIIDSMGNEVRDKEQFQLITYKEAWGTQSRTSTNYWGQLGIQPENFVVMNKQDADLLNIVDGDTVKVTSTSNPEGLHFLDNERSRPIVGKVQTIQGIRPGVVGISTHFGHWGYGANDVVVDSKVIKGDPIRGLGIHSNPLFRLDDNLNGTPMSEPIGGSVSFYDSRVNITKV
jgi:anaerobic selenocysteine-containing dehydrogenase